MSGTATLDAPELIKQFEQVVGKKLDEHDAAQKANFEKFVDDKIKAATEDMKREMAVHSLPGSADATHKGEKFNFAKALGSFAKGPSGRSLAPLEWEMSDQMRKQGVCDALRQKAMSFGVDTAGGFIVPSEVLKDQIIPLLYAKSIVAELGATRLDGLTTGVVMIPRVGGGVTAYWIGEGSTITASDMRFEQMKLEPHGLAAVSVASLLLSNLANPGFDTMLKADMARALALKQDLGALKGTGASGQPIGILNTTGVNASGVSSTPTFDELSDAIGAVEEDNALEGNLGWALSWADLQAIRKMKDATAPPATPGDGDVNVQPLGSRSLLTGTRGNEELMGFKVRMSTQLAAGDVIFGNWADLVLANWGAMALDMTDAVGFLTAQTHVRALLFTDTGVRHAVSFNVG
jgi:HK97 family phage major capsid protein